MNLDIINSLQDLLAILEQCRTHEKDEKTIELYNLHIKRTSEILDQLNKVGIDKTATDKFFEQEGRNYGWSYLPNDNGQIAEEAFWKLKNTWTK